MKVTEAGALLESAFTQKRQSTTWADLGCGGGIFTKSLAGLLGEGNKIFAVDKDSQRIQSSEANVATIEFVRLNFITETLPFSNLDGILMANSLHYVKDKPTFIEKVKKYLKADGQIIIVEYDTETSNIWIPYPVRFEKLVSTFSACGFSQIKKIGERNSIYRAEKMYACSLTRR